MNDYHNEARQVRLVRSIITAPVLTCERELEGMLFSDSPYRFSCNSPMVAVRRNFLRMSLVYCCKSCNRPIEIGIATAHKLKPHWTFKKVWWSKETL